MPLVWAHAEYVKLLRSLKDGFDMPLQTLQRYVISKTKSDYILWRYNHKCQSMPVGKTLRVELTSPAEIHWTVDESNTPHNVSTRDTGLGIYTADIPSRELASRAIITFTFHWQGSDHWERKDFVVTVK